MPITAGEMVFGIDTDHVESKTKAQTQAYLEPDINNQSGTTYTLQASDNGKVVVLTNGSAITVTIPSGLSVGFVCQCVQGGAGQVSFTTSGRTLHNRPSHDKIAGQYGLVGLESIATNVFILAGDTSA